MPVAREQRARKAGVSRSSRGKSGMSESRSSFFSRARSSKYSMVSRTKTRVAMVQQVLRRFRLFALREIERAGSDSRSQMARFAAA